MRRNHEETEDTPPPIEIPLDALSPDALAGVIESFVLREGTDYGASEVPLETKTRQVRKQLDDGKIRIVFDPATESVTLMTEHEWKKSQRDG